MWLRRGKIRNACRILVRKLLGKSPLGKTTGWNDNIQVDVVKIRCERVGSGSGSHRRQNFDINDV
jgi:hypothetical protein